MKIANKFHHGPGLVIWCLLLLLALCAAAEAQPSLSFNRVAVSWPTIDLYFSVVCDGKPAYNMTKQDFRIYENGVEVTDFAISCPDTVERQFISVALVFDASGSMSGRGNACAKEAGHVFIDSMDGVIDEATIIWFNTTVTLAQRCTAIKSMLHAAVDSLPATGSTAVWDGIYAGLIELINHGENQCRAVIAMTDGGDAASTHTPDEVIALANRHRIRVFTIGLGSATNSTQLEQIAQQTGGKYYETPDASQLAMFYTEISSTMFKGFQECRITYQKQCADSSLRTVQLQLNDFCGGDDAGTKTYLAPVGSPILRMRDYHTNALVFDDSADTYLPNPFQIRLTCMNTSDALATDVEGSLFLHPDMEFDPPDQPMTKQFTPSTMGKYMPPAQLPELTWTVRWTKRYRYNVTPEFRFTVTGKDCLGARLDSVEHRCQLAIPGLMPLFGCDAFEIPDSLVLNANKTAVEPNPFPVRFTIVNKSKQIGKITRVYISFPPDGLSLDPSSPNPMNQSLDLELDKNESRTFEWIIKVQNRITRRMPLITVTAIDDEGNYIPCEAYLPIAGVGTVSTGVPPVPATASLEQNRPNPWYSKTVIAYRLEKAGEYTLTLYDVLGREVRVLDAGQKPAGTFTYELDAGALPRGVYLYRLETASYSCTRRMILSR